MSSAAWKAKPALCEFPIIDLAPLLNGSDPQAVAKEIGHIGEHRFSVTQDP